MLRFNRFGELLSHRSLVYGIRYELSRNNLSFLSTWHLAHSNLEKNPQWRFVFKMARGCNWLQVAADGCNHMLPLAATSSNLQPLPQAATCSHKQPLATTCSYKQPLAATCNHLPKQPQAATRSHLQRQAATSNHLQPLAQAATCSHLQPLAATCSHKQPQAATSSHKQPLASGCKWLFFLKKNKTVHLLRPQWIYLLYNIVMFNSYYLNYQRVHVVRSFCWAEWMIWVYPHSQYLTTTWYILCWLIHDNCIQWLFFLNLPNYIIPTNKNGWYVSSHNLMVDHQVLRTTNVLTQRLQCRMYRYCGG